MDTHDQRVTIRNATSKDAKAIVELSCVERIATYGKFISSEYKKEFLDAQHVSSGKIDDLSRRLGEENQHEIHLVVCKGDQVIAYVSCINEGSVTQIKSLFVHATYQDQGIGKKLLYQIMSYFVDTTYVLRVLETNTRAIEVYKKIGFQFTNRAYPYYGLTKLEMKCHN